MDSWIHSSLSSDQKNPLERSTRSASILAAAGSGKTRTLTYALANDLAQGVPPEGVVAFTFTKKAASELLTRINILVNKHIPKVDVSEIYVGTIHSWCFDYLTEQSNFYNFKPLDELHLDSLVGRLYDDLGIEEVYNKRYPKGISDFTRDLELYYNENLDIEDTPEQIRGVISDFEAILRENRLLTYGGMIKNAIEELGEGGVEQLASLYVDEYQDVNPAQVELVKAMLPEESKLTAVGDHRQCIYNWRGSDVGRILQFPDEFDDTSVHRLSENYRSRPGIVDFANSVANNIERSNTHEMEAMRECTQGPVVTWVSTDEDKQAQVAASSIERFHGEGVPYDQMAILLRSVLSWGEPVVSDLEDRGIPYSCPILSSRGGLIDDLLVPLFGWLKRRPDEPNTRHEQEEIEAHAQRVEEAAERWGTVDDPTGSFWSRLREWMQLIDDKSNEGYNVRKQLYLLFEALGIQVGPRDHELTVGMGIASQIIRSVEEVHRRRIKGHPRYTPRKLMAEVYYALDRYAERFGESVPVESKGEGVEVTTVHQAKGREWPIVVIPELMSQRFPVSARGHSTSYPDSIAERYGTSIEDEWRLFYVAVTRAEDRLLLIDGAQKKRRRRSTFRRELVSSGDIDVRDRSDVSTSFWSVRPEELREPDEEPIRIGLSDLLVYLECPFQYGLRRRGEIQPWVGDELGYGKSLHELIQRRFEDEQDWSEDTLQDRVDEHVFLPLMSEEAEDSSKKAIQEKLEDLSEMSLFEGEVKTEVDVESIVGGSIVHGTVDGIVLHEDGTATIRDWKSNVHDTFFDRYRRQIQFYAHALTQRGIDVREADIVDVGASSKKGEVVTYPIDTSPDAVEGLVDDMEQAIAQITSEHFPATPDPHTCSACDTSYICKYSEADQNSE